MICGVRKVINIGQLAGYLEFYECFKERRKKIER